MVSDLDDLEFRLELLENSIIVAEKAADDLENKINDLVKRLLEDDEQGLDNF